MSGRSTLDTQDDILGVPVLASIPAMLSPRERAQRHRRRQWLWSAAGLALVILLAVVFVFLK